MSSTYHEDNLTHFDNNCHVFMYGCVLREAKNDWLRDTINVSLIFGKGWCDKGQSVVVPVTLKPDHKEDR